jgi:hypothetical protein
MPLQHKNFKVTTEPTVIAKIPPGVQQCAVQIYNGTGAQIFLGDSTVASSGATVGNSLSAGASVQVWLEANDELYAVCATSPSPYGSIIFSA